MKTFPLGGIHPEDNKLTSDKALEYFPLPQQAVLFATQHLGAPATIVVEKGDKVKVGQLLAKAETFVCANLHSPFSGTVAKIEVAIDMFGYKKPAIYIDVEGDEWLETIDRSSEIKRDILLSKEEIIEKIKEMGVVGLGGACFPTHIKYLIAPDKKPEYVIINAAECEPYLTSDNRVMIEKGEECMVGITILMKALGVHKALIGIENNKPEAIEIMKNWAAQFKGIEVVPLKTKYPQGAEKQLIKALVGREVPNGSLPIDAGCVVNNIDTAFSVYTAVQKNQPLIENITSITGKKLQRKGNFIIRIGTPLSNIFEFLGGIPEDTGKVISGGPMMGKAISNTDTYTVKGMSSILFMDETESKRGEVLSCIKCGKCVYACPMGLEPYLLQQNTALNRFEETEKLGMMNCIECGCCAFGCPAYRPLLDFMRLGKSKTGQLIKERNQK